MARWVRGFVFLLAVVLAPSTALSQALYVDGEIIVKMKDPSMGSGGQNKDFSKAQHKSQFMSRMKNQKRLSLRKSMDHADVYHFKIDAQDSMQAKIDELKSDPDVEYAEPNYILQKTSQVGIADVYSPEEIVRIAETEGLEALGVDESVQQAWSFEPQSVGSLSIDNRPIVAVIDTGLDINHQVFVKTEAVWVNTAEIANNGIDDDRNNFIDDRNGWNFVSRSAAMFDDDGHGTHVSGIILNVDQSIHVNPNTLVKSKIRIMPLKFLNGSGVGSTADAIQAIYYAVNNGAKVLNNSWGGYSYSAALHEAVTYAYENGVTFVAAAGNDGSNNDSRPMYPASYDVPNVIAVAATYDNFSLATFSNYGGTTVDLGAWGYYINSTIPDGAFGKSSGTSMSAPFVAGTAIQMIVQQGAMLGYQVKQIINSQTEYQPVLAGKVYTQGRLHPSNSIAAAAGATVDASQPDYTTSYSGNRELASSIAGGGGCGMVSTLYSQYQNNFNGRGGGNGSGTPGSGGSGALNTWYVLFILAVLLAPILLTLHLRRRNPVNKRRHERFNINSDVRVNLGGKELIGSVSTISLGGVQLNTDELLEHGGIITMTIQSPTGTDHVQVKGQIVWREEKKAYGVAFQDAPLSALERISAWTQTLKKAG